MLLKALLPVALVASACTPSSSAPTVPAAPAEPVATPTDAPAVGVASMQPDGTIVMDMFHPHARLTYPKTDAQYDEILKHIGGLKPGEQKSVPPFPDGIDEAKVNDAVAAWVAKNKGWSKRSDLRIEIYGTNAAGDITVGVGHGSEHVSLSLAAKTYEVTQN